MPDSLRPRPHVSGYFRIRNFFFPDTATLHTHPANSTANPEKINPLSRVEKNKSATNPITCGRVNPDIFESDDVKSVSSLSPNNKPVWRHNVLGEQSKFPATFSLYGACSEDILVQRRCRGALGTRVNPDTIGCVWTGEFDLNTLRVDEENFESGKKKLRIQKYSDTCKRGLSTTL